MAKNIHFIFNLYNYFFQSNIKQLKPGYVLGSSLKNLTMSELNDMKLKKLLSIKQHKKIR